MRDYADPPSYLFQDCPKTFVPAYSETYRTNHGPDATSSSFFCWSGSKNQPENYYSDVNDVQSTSYLFPQDASGNDVLPDLDFCNLKPFDAAPIKIKGEPNTNQDLHATESIDVNTTADPNQQHHQQQQQQHHHLHLQQQQQQQQQQVDAINRTSINDSNTSMFPSFPSFAADSLKDQSFIDASNPDPFHIFTRLIECESSMNQTSNLEQMLEECLDNIVAPDEEPNGFDGEMRDCIDWLAFSTTRDCKWADCHASFQSQESLVSLTFLLLHFSCTALCTRRHK